MSLEIIAIDDGEDEEKDKAEFFVETEALALVIVELPCVEEVAKGFKDLVWLGEHDDDIKEGRAAGEGSADVLEDVCASLLAKHSNSLSGQYTSVQGHSQLTLATALTIAHAFPSIIPISSK